MADDSRHFASADEALNYLCSPLPGHTAIITARSTSGQHYIFHAKRNPARDVGRGYLRVSVQCSGENEANETRPVGTCYLGHMGFLTAPKVDPEAPSVRAWGWLWGHLRQGGGELPPGLELWQPGRCGRCGRELRATPGHYGPKCILEVAGGE
jgi:hypothetical protein